MCILFETFNTLRPRQNGRCFTDDTFRCIFLNENVRIVIKISLKFVPKGPINNIPALFQIMACCRSGDKPLSEPMRDSLLTHICVSWLQWVKQGMVTLRHRAIVVHFFYSIFSQNSFSTLVCTFEQFLTANQWLSAHAKLNPFLWPKAKQDQRDKLSITNSLNKVPQSCLMNWM